MISLNQGILMSIEGIDGSGKSTLAHALHAHLSTQFPVILTKEPGATELGKKLRQILQEKPMEVEPKAEFLLFAADRAQHFSQLILPALDNQKIVISDRLSDSSLAYQGYGRGLSLTMIEQVNAWAMQHIVPDITFYIEISLETALERLKARKEKLTSFEIDSTFTQKVVQGFETIFKDRADVIRLDGTLSAEQLADQAHKACRAWMQEHNIY